MNFYTKIHFLLRKISQSKEVYPIIFIDAVHFNIKQENIIVKKVAYIILGVTSDGFKEVLGIWIGENESINIG